MKRERKTNGARLLAALLCVLMLLTLYTPCAWAADAPIDVSATTSLTVQYQVADQNQEDVRHNVTGLSVQLYRVATVSSDVKFRLTGEFAKYNVTVNNLTSRGWGALAGTLAGYAAADRLTTRYTGKTDQEGIVYFGDLPTGLYLVTASYYTLDGVPYQAQPFLACLPNRDENGQWLYDVKAGPKNEVLTEDQRLVQKVWRDNGQTSRRPDKITVQLLKNGEIYDTATLSEANGWRYQWDKLEVNAQWQIVEQDVPEGYTVLVEQQGPVFMMTNTRTPDSPDNPPGNPDNPPDNPDNPGTPTNPGNPDNPNNSGNPPGEPDTPPEFEIPDEGVPQGALDLPDVPDVFEEIPGEPVPLAFALPQTGMLWWPVPILATAGMLCYLIGWMKNRKLGEHHGN